MRARPGSLAAPAGPATTSLLARLNSNSAAAHAHASAVRCASPLGSSFRTHSYATTRASGASSYAPPAVAVRSSFDRGGSVRANPVLTGSLATPVSAGMSAAAQSSNCAPPAQAAHARARSPHGACQPLPGRSPAPLALQTPLRRASAPGPVDTLRIATVDSAAPAVVRPTPATPAPAADALPPPPAILRMDATAACSAEIPVPAEPEAAAEDKEPAPVCVWRGVSGSTATPTSGLSPGAGSCQAAGDDEEAEAAPPAAVAGVQVRASSETRPAAKMMRYGPALYAGKAGGFCGPGAISAAGTRSSTSGPAQYEGMRRRTSEQEDIGSSTFDISPILPCGDAYATSCSDVLIYQPRR